MLRIKISLLDLNASLRSAIASATSNRSAAAARLQATTQSTLDNLHSSLTSLRATDFPQSTTQKTRNDALPWLTRLHRQESDLGLAWGEFRTRVEGVKLRAVYAFTMGIAVVFLAVIVERTRRKSGTTSINSE